MARGLFAFAMCFLFAANGAYARYPDTEEAGSYIVMLKEPSLSRSMLDKHGRSLYKGIAARPNRHHERAFRHRIKMEERLGRFENRLKRISPRILRRRRFTGLLNGMSVEMPKGYVSRIRSLPEVLSVVPNRRYHFSLTRSNDLMNAPLIWQLAGGQDVAGQGIKIGIIDTGIDHTHPMFDDERFILPEGYPLGDSNFTNKKIIVARVFTKDGDSLKDSTPRDRHGHGTHVASVAAGNSKTGMDSILRQYGGCLTSRSFCCSQNRYDGCSVLVKIFCDILSDTAAVSTGTYYCCFHFALPFAHFSNRISLKHLLSK